MIAAALAAAGGMLAALSPLLPLLAAAAGAVVAVMFGGDWWLASLAAAGLAGFVLIWRLWGLKAALAWLLAVAAILIDQRAAERGAEAQRTKDQADAAKRADARERIVQSVTAADGSELRRRARRWVSD